ncbi:MAG: non-ribosomal peptide synthetase [Caldilineaceae bacterium]|nr:non-ribosomal peptide synthetase [Caldilineaceae bacterium]
MVQTTGIEQLPQGSRSWQERDALALYPSPAWEEFPSEALEQSIPTRFEAMAARYADRIAVKTPLFEFTYEQLNAFANRIAHTLLARYGQGNHRVALLLDNDAPLLAAMYGVLKAGKAYVILDPSFPRERLSYFFEESGAVALVTDAEHEPLAQQIAPDPKQRLGLEQIPTHTSDHNPNLNLDPRDIALIVYTSGSTGRPKGVYNNHRNLLKYVSLLANRFYISPQDRFTCLRSFSVNGALKDLFLSTLSGASVYPFHPNQHGYRALTHWIRDHGLTIYNSSVTAFRQVLTYLGDADAISTLRLVLIGAEPVRLSDVELYRKWCAPYCILTHSFGATETSSFATRIAMDKQTHLDLATLPAGYPSADVEILILDDDLQPLPSGEVGEIAVKSSYLALGYWNRPDLTRQRFLPVEGDPTQRIYLSGDVGYLLADGCLIHLGRKDAQSKIRGIRIDIGEIEHRLTDHPAIAQAAVAVKQDENGAEKLVAYMVPQGSPRPTVTELRAFLAGWLTEQMVPTAYVWLERLPTTLQGKLDRMNLPMPGYARPHLAIAYRAPQTPLEEQLTAIWSGVLAVDEIGVDDPFLDLGGDSLKAMQILTQVMALFQVEIKPSDLFVAQTIAEMTLVILQHQMTALNSEEFDTLLASLGDTV